MIDNAHLLKREMTPLNERNDGPLFKMKNDPRYESAVFTPRQNRRASIIQCLKG